MLLETKYTNFIKMGGPKGVFQRSKVLPERLVEETNILIFRC